jgi:hypothetical protein
LNKFFTLGIVIIVSSLLLSLDCWFFVLENIGIRKLANIKLCALLHKSLLETLLILEKAYGKAAVKETQVYKWHKRLHDD